MHFSCFLCSQFFEHLGFQYLTSHRSRKERGNREGNNSRNHPRLKDMTLQTERSHAVPSTTNGWRENRTGNIVSIPGDDRIQQKLPGMGKPGSHSLRIWKAADFSISSTWGLGDKGRSLKASERRRDGGQTLAVSTFSQQLWQVRMSPARQVASLPRRALEGIQCLLSPRNEGVKQGRDHGLHQPRPWRAPTERRGREIPREQTLQPQAAVERQRAQERCFEGGRGNRRSVQSPGHEVVGGQAHCFPSFSCWDLAKAPTAGGRRPGLGTFWPSWHLTLPPFTSLASWPCTHSRN